MSRKQSRSVGDNGAFATLVRVAQDDPEIRQTLVPILRQPPFHRKLLLNTLLRDMRAQDAPKNLISAITELLNAVVAEKVAEETMR